MALLVARFVLAAWCVGTAWGDVEDDIVVKLVSDQPRSLPTFEELWSLAADEMAWVVDLRRELHRLPELMYNETVTSRKIAQVLTSLGIEYTVGWARNTKRADLAAKGFQSGFGGTGLVAEIGTGRSPCVLLRADIDALPIHESAALELPFASENEGRMHACGHDAHAAMLVGAAAVLKKREALLNGTVRLIWQPAEEGAATLKCRRCMPYRAGGAGGKRMVEEGVLSKEPAVGAAFGFHQWPFEPIGVVAGRPNTQMAATEIFDILISGVGGHAAMPHMVKDPIVAASHIVTSLQSIASRETSPLDSAVVSVTMFHAGSAYNVIPTGASIGGAGALTFFSQCTALQLAAAAHRCNASISWSPDAYPPTVNDPSLFEWVTKVASESSTTGSVKMIEPTMGGEDFSFIAQQVPSVFLVLGQGNSHWALPEDPKNILDTTVTVHNPKFVLNEEVLQRGVALHAHLAIRWLGDQPSHHPL